MPKQKRSGDTIGATIFIPKELSLKLSRLIIDKSERGERLTKPDLIIEYIEKGIEQETK
jgi:hypothetical protein